MNYESMNETPMPQTNVVNEETSDVEQRRPAEQYRINLDWIGSSGTIYYRVERRGFLGLWWTIADGQRREKAEKILKELSSFP